jgi:DNA mismatch repair protein MutL
LIHILDSHAANQIAAGEVVERPVSVVKELVENSLDAGAKHVDITVEGNGVPLIKVRDDGNGIGATDLPLTVVRHATSKIRRIEDLDYLQTLGFRGEALPSIASVSDLEITSRPKNETIGFCLVVSGGEQNEIKEVGCPTGTTVSVQNLFFNTPARLKFLKSTPTEFGLISDMIGRMALAHSEVAFSLTHPRNTVLQTSGRGDLCETIGSILGHDIARRLIPIETQQDNWILKGFISPPELVRSSKQAQTFIINGRVVRSPFLNRALEEGYHTLIPSKLHPVVILHLHVSPSDYDVNVHPTKMDIRFKNESDLLSFISKAIYQTLIQSKSVPSFHTKTDHSLKSELAFYPLDDFKSVISKQVTDEVFQPIRETETKLQVNQSVDDLTDSAFQEMIDKKSDVSSASPREVLKSPKNLFLNDVGYQPQDDILSEVWPIAQLFNTYILASNGESLLMIDQHAAHERINYERLLVEFQQMKESSQALLIPIPMEFTLQEEQVLLENLWALTEMGFILEQFGSQTYLLRGVPVLTGSFSADMLLRQFIEDVLQNNSKPTFDKLLQEWIYLLACKESIKAKESLTLPEMERIIAKLKQTQNPYTCPHGRPTMIKMTRSEIERRFYRS